ncbi:MAG: hypothetical protein ABUL69_01425, partial [Peristeroidobacter soli]
DGVVRGCERALLPTGVKADLVAHEVVVSHGRLQSLEPSLPELFIPLRGVDERDTYGSQMRAIVATLPDDKAITDVVAYINTLK